MGGLIEIAGALLARSTAHAEVAAQNIANTTTSGYKARVAFDRMIDRNVVSDQGADLMDRLRDWSDGRIVPTNDPLDLAVSGSGFLVVRTGETMEYTRGGHFVRDAEGRLVTSGGGVLQGIGGDVVVADAAPVIARDGSVSGAAGVAAQRIMLVDSVDRSALRDRGDGLFAAVAEAMHDLPGGTVVQGALEASNVSDGAEMIAIMTALRGAETGQRVVQLYGDLMTQAIDSLGQRTA